VPVNVLVALKEKRESRQAAKPPSQPSLAKPPGDEGEGSHRKRRTGAKSEEFRI
jgi:hypothetical protein